jgi:hypothetical protein
MSGHGSDDSTTRERAPPARRYPNRRPRAPRRCPESHEGAASHDAGRTPSPQLADGDPSRAFEYLRPSSTRSAVSGGASLRIKKRQPTHGVAALLRRFRSPDCHIAAGCHAGPTRGRVERSLLISPTASITAWTLPFSSASVVHLRAALDALRDLRREVEALRRPSGRSPIPRGRRSVAAKRFGPPVSTTIVPSAKLVDLWLAEQHASLGHVGLC